MGGITSTQEREVEKLREAADVLSRYGIDSEATSLRKRADLLEAFMRGASESHGSAWG